MDGPQDESIQAFEQVGFHGRTTGRINTGIRACWIPWTDHRTNQYRHSSRLDSMDGPQDESIQAFEQVGFHGRTTGRINTGIRAGWIPWTDHRTNQYRHSSMLDSMDGPQDESIQAFEHVGFHGRTTGRINTGIRAGWIPWTDHRTNQYRHSSRLDSMDGPQDESIQAFEQVGFHGRTTGRINTGIRACWIPWTDHRTNQYRHSSRLDSMDGPQDEYRHSSMLDSMEGPQDESIQAFE